MNYYKCHSCHQSRPTPEETHCETEIDGGLWGSGGGRTCSTKRAECSNIYIVKLGQEIAALLFMSFYSLGTKAETTLKLTNMHLKCVY